MFSSPSIYFIDKSGLGIAVWLASIDHIAKMEEPLRTSVIEGMKKDGEPVTLREAFEQAADFVNSARLGWFKRNRFYSSIYFSLINNFGYSRSQAQYYTELIKVTVKAKR